MNLQISCQVNGNTEYIELGGVDKVTLDVSFAEIQDITKKNSAYSKEFNVPGSNGNNYIFEYFFDLNQVPLNFIPTKKFEAQLLYNGYLIASGYIRLNTVTTVKEEKTYNITFYNGVGDVAAAIGDKFMAQLDLSHLSHPFTPSVYLQSQIDYNLFPLTGTTDYSYQNGKTFWGLYNIGYNYVSSLSAITALYTGTTTSSVSITSGNKTIIASSNLPFIPGDTIRLTNAGSNYWIQGVVQSNNGSVITFKANLALGSGTFSSWNITLEAPEGLSYNDPDTTPIIDFQASNIPNFMSFSGTPIRNYYFKPSIQVKELYQQIFNQADYLIESEFFETNYFERYYLPLKFLDETVYTQGSEQPCYTWQFSANNPTQGVTCNNGIVSANTTSIQIDPNYAGEYTFAVSVQSTLSFGACPSTNTYDVYLDINGTQYFVAGTLDCDEYPGIYSVSIAGRVTVNLTGTSVITIIPPPAASSIEQVSFSIETAPRFIIGNFNYANEFPQNDFKQIDFITSVNRLFNLVVVPHPTKQKTLIVEPIIDYIGKGRILDWTSKIDWDSPITISPTTNILNGTLNFNFTLDQDYANQQFNISNNRVFGTYELQLNQDYKDNKIDFNTIFSSPVDTTLNNGNTPNITISNFATIKTEENKGSSIQQFKPYKILPRLLFRGLVYPNDNWGVTTGGTQTWWAETYQQDRWQETNRFTTYPFNYSGFSHYTNFNAGNSFDPDESTFPNEQDMYDIYYYDYISDIVSPQNKIMKSKIYLTPYEIADLRFDEKIVIKNSYWRINKISGYNLTEPSLCDIELIKLTKDYTPHPVLYYDLISCSGGTDYHSTSDLNYNLYAYVGNYVNLFTGSTTAYTSIGCYEVVLGTPNSNYDYNQVFIGSGYTSTGVAVYNNCGCSGRTSLDLVQQT
jgi:hypothetical protein